MTPSDSMLTPSLVERVLSKLGLTRRPTVDLDGLNTVYAAWSGSVPFDNVQKRIWFAGDRQTPPTGGEAIEFFENWLAHGTGGTCWPVSEGIYTLLHTLGFNARRTAGSMIASDETATRADHGTVLVDLEGIGHLVDASILAFEVLPLVPGLRATAGKGIHAIQSVPTKEGFDVLWNLGRKRNEPARFRTDSEYDAVDHAFFLDGYQRSTRSGPFNDALYIYRHFRDSIVTVGRKNKITVAASGQVRTTELADAERKRVLIDELGLSEEITERLPADAADGGPSA